MNKKVKVGVIGLGIGMAHAQGYQACQNAELVAVCDTDPARLEERGEKLGIRKENRYSTVDEILAVPEIEAVSVTLPNFLHAPISIAALKAGKHVICEKPLAKNAIEAQAIVDTAKQAGKNLMVCFNYRFREDARWLKAMNGSGKFGNLYFAKVGWMRNRGIPGGSSWFVNKELAGGGPLIDLGVHVLDLTLWLMGYPKVISVSGTTFAQFGPRGMKSWTGDPYDGNRYSVEDLAAGFIRFADGSALSLETSWATHTKPGRDDYFVTLYGSEGGSELYVANYTDRDTISYFSEVEGSPAVQRPSIVTKGGGHEKAVAHFIDCILEGRKPEATGEQGVTLMRLIDGIYESARLGREVRFD
jgi:predicted dehydrogenase